MSMIKQQKPGGDEGFALVLVLAFIALLVGIALAFLSNSLLQRQVSDASSNQAKVSILADGAVDVFVSSLLQQITNGSNTSSPGTGVTIYTPTSADKMLPLRDSNLVGIPGLENMIGVSTISGGKSTNDTSEPRPIDLKRWNKPLFVAPASATDNTPVTAFPTVPEWIYVQRNGKQVAAPSSSASSSDFNDQNATIGRYAYVVYDEGGLLDINVAGYPDSLVGVAAMNRKIGLPYVNLTDLKDSAGGNLFTREEAKKLTDWRDYATAQTVSAAATPESAYAQSTFSNRTGFLNPPNSPLSSGQSDRKFIGRQQLIDFVANNLNSTGTRNALQYLTTFSRDLNQPSFIPAVQKDTSAPTVLPVSSRLPYGGNSAAGNDKIINPNLLATRVTTSFTRNDGSTTQVGEPLVKSRFALQRLAWITYKGPSADRADSADADIQKLLDLGVSKAYLKLGTAENIRKYFGLNWDGHRWQYNIHFSTSSSGGHVIAPLGSIKDHDPDFFELLKAGIAVGSLGKAAAISNTSITGGIGTDGADSTVPQGYFAQVVPDNLKYSLDSSVDYHIIQIGANILNEANPTSYPIRITFDDGSARGELEFQGVTDLPYLYCIYNGIIRETECSPAPITANGVADSNPFQYPKFKAGGGNGIQEGNAYVIQVPVVWNPYDPNGTQSTMRPTNFRVMVDSNDPLSLQNDPTGSSDMAVWCAALASEGSGGNNASLYPASPRNPVFSYKTSARIHDGVTFTDVSGSGPTLYREPTLILRTSVGHAQRVTGPNASPFSNLSAISSIQPNPVPGAIDAKGTQFAPLVLGAFPLAFAHNGNELFTGTAVIGPERGTPKNPNDCGDMRVYFTYQLQYQDASGQWITYDTKYGRTTSGQVSFQDCHTNPISLSPSIIYGPASYSAQFWATALDPRSGRFGLIMGGGCLGRSYTAYVGSPSYSETLPVNAYCWMSLATGGSELPANGQGITNSVRPLNDAGFMLMNEDPSSTYSGTFDSATLSRLPMKDVPYPTFLAGWTLPIGVVTAHGAGTPLPLLVPGMYAQNNPKAPAFLARFNPMDTSSTGVGGLHLVSPSYYADADGVVRRASGAYVSYSTNVRGSPSSAGSLVGLPTVGIQGFQFAIPGPSPVTPATTSNSFPQAQSRPLLLHRPFRSVAELGYVFRDLPWKNLDFFTPESGDGGLLDLFCINEVDNSNGLVAGKISLNTRQKSVLAAVLAGAYVDDPKISNATVGGLSPTAAQAIAAALISRTSSTDLANYGPLQNISELVGKWRSSTAASPPSGVTYSPTVAGVNAGIDLKTSDGFKDGQASYIGFSSATSTSSGSTPKNLTDALTSGITDTTLRTSMTQIQRFREAPIRALSAVGQTRVWNLMIDVIAQTGRSSSGVNPFAIQGEQRYWVHLAIDRFTGKVIDKQVEIVKE
jgi:hypothetical protein